MHIDPPEPVLKAIQPESESESESEDIDEASESYDEHVPDHKPVYEPKKETKESSSNKFDADAIEHDFRPIDEIVLRET